MIETTSGTTSRRRARATRSALVVCLVALIPLAARALWWLPAFQERRVAGLSSAALEALTRREPENAVALLAYGRRLGAEGRYADALVPLQNAAGLEPDDGRIREAWSLAKVAGGYVTGAFGQLTQFVRTHPDDLAISPLLRAAYQGFHDRFSFWIPKPLVFDERLCGVPDYLIATRSAMGKSVLESVTPSLPEVT